MSACQEGSILQLYGNRKFWAWHSSVPPPTYLFIGLFICILYYILLFSLGIFAFYGFGKWLWDMLTYFDS